MRANLLAVMITALCATSVRAKMIEIPSGDDLLDASTVFAVNYTPR